MKESKCRDIVPGSRRVLLCGNRISKQDEIIAEDLRNMTKEEWEAALLNIEAEQFISQYVSMKEEGIPPNKMVFHNIMYGGRYVYGDDEDLEEKYKFFKSVKGTNVIELKDER